MKTPEDYKNEILPKLGTSQFDRFQTEVLKNLQFGWDARIEAIHGAGAALGQIQRYEIARSRPYAQRFNDVAESIADLLIAVAQICIIHGLTLEAVADLSLNRSWKLHGRPTLDVFPEIVDHE